MTEIKYIILALLWGLGNSVQAQTNYFEISDACITDVIQLNLDATLSPFNGHDVYSGVGTVNGNSNVGVLMYFASSWVIEFGSAGVYYYNPSTATIPPTSGWIPIDVNGNGNSADDCEGDSLTVTMSVSLGIDRIELKTEVLDDRVDMKWTVDQADDVQSFRIEKNINAGEWQVLGRVPAYEDILSYLFRDELRPNSQILYRVVAELEEGQEKYSNTCLIAQANSQSISLFPNPASNVLNIELENSEPAELHIYDYLGREVLVSQLIGNSLDISNLKSGYYILRLHSNSGMLTSTFVKE